MVDEGCKIKVLLVAKSPLRSSALVPSLGVCHVVAELELIPVLVLHIDIPDSPIINMLLIILSGILPARGAGATRQRDTEGRV
jgi:hypothetical protein